MNVPGSNLLNIALSVIQKQSVLYYAENTRTLNDIGQDVTVYDAPRELVGSFQPVPRRMYEKYGLDLQKTYYTFYTSNDVRDVERDISGDQLVYGADRFQCESNNEWYRADGWKGILVCRVGKATDFLEIFGFGAALPSINTNLNFEHGNFAPEDA